MVCFSLLAVFLPGFHTSALTSREKPEVAEASRFLWDQGRLHVADLWWITACQFACLPHRRNGILAWGGEIANMPRVDAIKGDGFVGGACSASSGEFLRR